MSQIEPGSRLWPYHTHHLNEERVIVLRGEPTLRTPGCEHVVEEGDVVSAVDPATPIGAWVLHQAGATPVCQRSEMSLQPTGPLERVTKCVIVGAPSHEDPSLAGGRRP